MSSVELSPTAPSATTPSSKVRHLWRRPATGTYYARVRLPPGLGKGDHLQESLRTKDEREALRRLPHVVARLLAERERLQRDGDGALKNAPMTPGEWAKWWRGAVIEQGGDPDRGRIPDSLELELDMEVERRLGQEVGEETDEDGMLRPTYEPEAEREALELLALARGERSPISAELDRYLAERKLKARYASRSRRAVKALVSWRRLRAGGDDLRRIDRREAGLFVDHLRSKGLSTATANSLVSSLSAYWDWMERRGVAEANPWTRQTIRPTEDEAERKVRPFTEEEALKLLSGETNRTLHDLMRFGALAGMRINEIANLRASDIDGDVLHIRKAKTAAGVRRVPIHSALKAIVTRRTTGKAPDEFLFDELKGPPSRPTERSAKASERFTEYRRACGIEELSEGQRNSSVNFHSWRHYFITQALHAGQPVEIVAAVVGHKSARSSVTLATYNSTGPSLAQLQAVVDTVGLPKGAPVDSPEGPLMNSGTRMKRRRGRPAA